MKLKNKKTGEIGELQITEKHCAVVVGNGTASCEAELYSSLAKLNAEWEEPKTEFYITAWGDIREYTTEEERFAFKQKLEIGNYFETREEAEESVRKLKAWKRLKDKGFRLEGWTIDDGLRISICTNIDSDGIYDEYRKEVKKDLDVCFGGEDE